MIETEIYNIKIIGLGGIGTYLCDPLFRFLNSVGNNISVTLIDGDKYELKNIDRQVFSQFNSYKAEQKYKEYNQIFHNIAFEYHNVFVNPDNISELINDNDVVFLCVDNHKTRKIINDYVNTLNNIILISGGNDYFDGNTQIFIKENGKKKLPSLTDYHSEIINYNDKSPEEMSCEELQNSEPQLIFSNLFAATLMNCVFYNIFTYKTTNNVSDIYFDIIQLSSLPKVREVK
jgi:molybdopterin/thiamine biosynthesis adenylyltransferase